MAIGVNEAMRIAAGRAVRSMFRHMWQLASATSNPRNEWKPQQIECVVRRLL